MTEEASLHDANTFFLPFVCDVLVSNSLTQSFLQALPLHYTTILPFFFNFHTSTHWCA